MRKIVYGINISIDGCCDHTAFRPSEGVYEYFISLMNQADLVVYGRNTYELMFPYWADVLNDPDATKDELAFAEMITAKDKLVFSKTLEGVDYNTRLMHGNLAEEITRLKQLPGKDISLGGVNLRSQLVALGLVDEFHFLVHPVLVGHGRYLFDEGSLPATANLKLVNTKTFDSGCVALHYVKG